MPSAFQIWHKDFYLLEGLRECTSTLLVLTLFYLVLGRQTSHQSTCRIGRLFYYFKHIYISIHKPLDRYGILLDLPRHDTSCSWVSTNPSIPSLNETCGECLKLMFWAVVGPELVVAWAFQQRWSAHRLEKLNGTQKRWQIIYAVCDSECPK